MTTGRINQVASINDSAHSASFARHKRGAKQAIEQA